MHKNPDYSKLFRGRPLRFILPLNASDSQNSSNLNLIKINDINEDLDNSKVGKSKIHNIEETNKEANVLQKKAEAYKLSNGNIFVKPELLCDLGCETPRINYEFNLGKAYRYFYAISSDVDIENPGTVKII